MNDVLNEGRIDEPELLSHERCGAHTLNFIATINAEHAELDSISKRSAVPDLRKARHYAKSLAVQQFQMKFCPKRLACNSCREKGNSSINSICHSLDLPR